MKGPKKDMSDRGNWERERTRDRGSEGNRENRERGREEWRGADWDRESRYSAEERNRPWAGENRYGYEEDEWNRGRQREDYGDRQRYDESRGGYGGREGTRDYGRRGDYGPSAFTNQFRGGSEYFGTGQRGFGTTWGGSGYGGWGGSSGYSGGIGSYGEQGRYAGRGPKGYQRSDERIREDLCEHLTRHPEIDPSEIEIQVKNGDVTLTGTVNRREEKRMAEDIAESVSGVKEVHNQLRAQHQGEMASQGAQSGQSRESGQTSQGSRGSGSHQNR